MRKAIIVSNVGSCDPHFKKIAFIILDGFDNHLTSSPEPLKNMKSKNKGKKTTEILLEKPNLKGHCME